MIDESKVAAILCADLHLSHKPPAARSSEPDWYKTQAGYLTQLRELADRYNVPVICAGDVFDDGWRSHRCPPELINLALTKMPQMYAVPGQHDLMFHRLDQLDRSAFGVLVTAGKVKYLAPDVPVEVPGRQPLRLHGFPWSVPLKSLKDPHDMYLEVAVAHTYAWVKGKGYAGADEFSRFKALKEKLIGYDAVVFGDNHIPWHIESGGKGFPAAWNCGGLMRRRTDEVDHRPRVGLLRDDGTIDCQYLDVSKDKLAAKSPEPAIEGWDATALKDLVTELKGLEDKSLDFEAAVMRLAETAPERVRRRVLGILGGKK